MAKSTIIPVKQLDLPKFAPSLMLDEDDLPQLKNLKVGDKCVLKVSAELVHQSQGKDYADSDEDKMLSGRFKVLGVEYEPSAKDAPRSDKLSHMKAKANAY